MSAEPVDLPPGASADPPERRPHDSAGDPHRAILVVGAAAIAYFTLFPFDVSIGDLADAVPRLDPSRLSLVRDVLLNVVLFTVFGYGLAGSGVLRMTGAPWKIGGTAIAGLILSTAIEVVQGWTLVRFPAITDIGANTLGAALGAALFVVFDDRIRGVSASLVDAVRQRTTAPRMAGLNIVVLLAVVLVAAWAASLTSLDGWDEDQPLLIGNELGGNREWRGRMLDVSLLDRAVEDAELGGLRDAGLGSFSNDEFVVQHDFTSPATGTPRLVTNDRDRIPAASPNGVELGTGTWLRTRDAARSVIAPIRAASEFTLAVTMVAADLDQSGPARLVSISTGLRNRNVTIGQQYGDLVVRIRTPLSGSDGTAPEWIFPDVFVADTEQHLVLRFDQSRVQVDVDGQHTEIVLLPDTAALLASFPNTIEGVRAEAFGAVLRRAGYATFAYAVPISTLAALLSGARADGRRRRAALLTVAALIPAVTVAAAVRVVTGVETTWWILPVDFVVSAVLLVAGTRLLRPRPIERPLIATQRS